MRLAIATFFTANLVVILCVAKTSSQKGSKSHHQPIDIYQLAARSGGSSGGPMVISDHPSPSPPAPSLPSEFDWKGAADEDSVKGSHRNKKKKGRGDKKANWAKKRKRKHHELSSHMESDGQQSSLNNLLPTPPSHLPRQATAGIECCPTVTDVIQPRGGVNMEGHLVQLYRPDGVDQRIYEHSCQPDVIDKPCRFVEKSFRPLSRCVQQYSYTYALVESHGDGREWRMDYIRVRSGCACEIQPL